MATSDACASSGLTVEAQAWLARLPTPVRPHGMAMYAPATAMRGPATVPSHTRLGRKLEVSPTFATSSARFT